MFWVISVYFNIRNTLPKSDTFLLGHSVYVCFMYARMYVRTYRGADKSLARPGRKQARKRVRDTRDFNNIETRAVIKCVFLQGKAPKEIHAFLKETSASFLPDRAKDL